VLILRDGDGCQRLVELGEGDRELSIGREPSSDLALEWDTEVSRLHAVLQRVGEAWVLIDDGLSRNGSFVDGQRVHGRRRLEAGDVIRLGRTVLVFAAAGAGELTGAAVETRPQQAPPELSPAQRRVLAALCRPVVENQFAAPASNREIAGELFVSVDTVKSHLHALFELFGVGDVPQNRKRAELVRLAFERGALTG
jgi:predicted component of type VI protein secretion system